MLDTPEVKKIYQEIQKKLYYMIPEKWESVYLYASITDKAYQMPIGEMYFYYFPKSFIKKNAVNVYEIPSKFNIDEKEYVKLVKNLYGSIESLRELYRAKGQKLWTNVTISIENFRFKISYNYDSLNDGDFSNFDRHVIWRYEHLGLDIKSVAKKERKIIERYLSNKTINQDNEVYDEPVYKAPLTHILDYNHVSKFEAPLELGVMEDFEIERRVANNQILAGISAPKVHKYKKIDT